MLILTVEQGKKIIIGAGNNQIEVQIIKDNNGSYDIGIHAPRHIPVDLENVRKSKLHALSEMVAHVPE